MLRRHPQLALMLGGSFRGAIRPGFIDPRFSVTRTHTPALGSDTFFDGAGVLREAAQNEPIFEGAGREFRITPQRTNLFADARALTSGSIAVTAQPYTISFYGTGSVTLSGAATATINGTGANSRVIQTFTPTAGTLTFTVTGTVTSAQLETGSFATPVALPLVGAPQQQTIGTTLVTAPLSAFGIPASGACTVLMTFRPQALGIESFSNLLTVSDGSTNNRYGVSFSASGDVFPYRVTAGSGIGGDISKRVASGVVDAAGITADGAGRVATFLVSGIVVSITGAPTTGLTTLSLANIFRAEPLYGSIPRLRILPYAVDDATLRAMTAAFLPT